MIWVSFIIFQNQNSNFLYRILGVVYFLNIVSDRSSVLKYSNFADNLKLIGKLVIQDLFMFYSIGNGDFNLLQPEIDCLIPIPFFNFIVSLYFAFCLGYFYFLFISYISLLFAAAGSHSASSDEENVYGMALLCWPFIIIGIIYVLSVKISWF